MGRDAGTSIAHTSHCLCKDPPGLGLRQPRALLYEVEERDAGAALHHEEVVVRVLEHGHAPAVADQSEAGIVVT